MIGASERWIKFLRQYGPVPRNDNMFDEHIRKSANRLGVQPITFKHPFEDQLLATFDIEISPQNVVLTGTTGDGKSHLYGRIWQALGGTAEEWATDEVYYQLHSTSSGQPARVHVIRDLAAPPDTDPKGRYTTKAALLEHLSTRHCQRKTGLSWGEASCNCLRMKNPFRYFKTSPEIIRLAVMM